MLFYLQCNFFNALVLWSNSVEACGLLHHQPCISQIQGHSWNKKGTRTPLHAVFLCMWRTSIGTSSNTHVTWRLSSGRLTLLLEQRRATSHWGRWCFPLCPGSGWRLLFVPPLIAWRIDSEQYGISRTVIKPHYSFFTTSIWVLETQWPTVKWHLFLLTAWPLSVSLSLPHFAAPALLSPYVSFESSALISGLCPLSFTEQSAIQCDFFFPHL